MSVKEYNPMIFKTVTNTPIPHSLTPEMNQIYSNQLSDGLNLPEHLNSENAYCKNGYKYIPSSSCKPHHEGIIVYTESDVILLPKQRVCIYYSMCSLIV